LRSASHVELGDAWRDLRLLAAALDPASAPSCAEVFENALAPGGNHEVATSQRAGVGSAGAGPRLSGEFTEMCRRWAEALVRRVQAAASEPAAIVGLGRDLAGPLKASLVRTTEALERISGVDAAEAVLPETADSPSPSAPVGPSGGRGAVGARLS